MADEYDDYMDPDCRGTIAEQELALYRWYFEEQETYFFEFKITDQSREWEIRLVSDGKSADERWYPTAIEAIYAARRMSLKEEGH